MLDFTKRKFLSLSPKQKYKKISDQLKYVLLYCPSDWQKHIKVYNELVTWTDELNQFVPIDQLDSSLLMTQYLHWRQKAELGPENDLFNSFTHWDSLSPVSSPIEWSILLHNIRSGYNVGAAIRTVDCFGLSEVHVSGYTTDTSNKSLKSSAMGTENWVPVTRWDSPFECLSKFEDKATIVALETDPDAISVSEFRWPEKGILLVGNEELGIPQDLLEKAHHTVNIPMYGRKASINVTSALSIALFHLRDFFEKKENAPYQ